MEAPPGDWRTPIPSPRLSRTTTPRPTRAPEAVRPTQAPAVLLAIEDRIDSDFTDLDALAAKPGPFPTLPVSTQEEAVEAASYDSDEATRAELLVLRKEREKRKRRGEKKAKKSKNKSKKMRKEYKSHPSRGSGSP